MKEEAQAIENIWLAEKHEAAMKGLKDTVCKTQPSSGKSKFIHYIFKYKIPRLYEYILGIFSFNMAKEYVKIWMAELCPASFLVFTLKSLNLSI